MNKEHDQKSDERVPFSLFHAAVEREKEDAAKQHHVEMIRNGQINIFEVDPHKKQTKEANGMQEQAMQKLRNEMANNKTNAYVQAVGEYLVNYIQSNQASAENFIDEKKTILGSLDAMRKAAEKKKQGNFAMLAPQEGFAIVLQYFGVNAKAETINIQQPVRAPVHAPVKIEISEQPQTVEKNKPRFEASLEDFL